MPPGFSLRLAVLAAAAAAIAAAADDNCPPDGWHQYRDKCYWVSNYTLNGRSVAPVCASMITGAEPVSIHDLDLDAFIAEDLVKGERAWLGLYRADTNADWIWLDGSPLNFTMWHEASRTRAEKHAEALTGTKRVFGPMNPAILPTRSLPDSDSEFE